MPHTNGAILARVKVTETGRNTEEETLPYNAAFDVVVEAEAGEGLFNGGGAYRVDVFVQDLTTGYSNVFTNTVSGNFGTAPWSVQSAQFRFAVPAQGAAKENHVLRAFAVLKAGINKPIVDFEEGDVCIITAP